MKKIIKILVSLIILLCIVSGVIYYVHTKQHMVVFIGDSITYLGEETENGFVRQFRKSVPERITTISAGVCGETTEQIKERMDSDVVSKNPDTVFIMAGINNIWNIDNPDLDKAIQDMSEMVDIAKLNQIEPIILNITLYTEDLSNNRNLNIDKYNDFLAKIAKEKNVQLIDINSVFKKEIAKRGDTNLVLAEDDLHLNEHGNTIVAETVLNDFYKTHKLKWMLF